MYFNARMRSNTFGSFCSKILNKFICSPNFYNIRFHTHTEIRNKCLENIFWRKYRTSIIEVKWIYLLSLRNIWRKNIKKIIKETKVYCTVISISWPHLRYYIMRMLAKNIAILLSVFTLDHEMNAVKNFFSS